MAGFDAHMNSLTLLPLFVRYRVVLGVIASLLTLGALIPASQLSFDQSIESLYAKDDPLLQAFRRSKLLFGGDELAMVAYTDPALESAAGKQRMRKLARELSELPGLIKSSVQSLAGTLDQASRLPLVSIPHDQLREMAKGVLVGEDQVTTAIIARFVPDSGTGKTATPASGPDGARLAVVPRPVVIRAIRQVAERFQLETGLETHVVGEPIQVHEAFRYVEEDGLWLSVYSTGLLLIVILILFRSLRWTVLPLIVVFVTVVWTRALLVILQMQLSMVSSMLNSLVTIIGVATVIHIALAFRERRAHLLGRIEALTETLVEMTPAIFWTCETTALGFLVLVSSDIRPVSSFGWMMTFGTMLVLPAIAMCVPLGALVGSVDSEVGHAPAEATLDRQLGRVSVVVESAPVALSFGLVTLVVVSLLGCLWLKPETDFSKNFRASSPIVRGLDFIERKLGGSATWEVNFPMPEELTNEHLQQVAKLAEELRQLRIADRPALTKVVAISDGEALVPRTFLTMQLQRRLWLLDQLQPEFSKSLYNSEHHRMRILLRTRERQTSAEKLQIIRDVSQIARKYFPDSETTGLFVLLSHLINSLLKDQWVSFVLAGFGIVAMTSMALRSLTLGLISLIPNVFPIILVIGTMGWLGFPVNIATAMISSVSMGLTVDSSIHFLMGYQRARKRGRTCGMALRETNCQVGRALVFANAALIAGFLVLCASHFIPLVYFGFLVSVAMLGGLIGNLLMLPLLVSWLSRESIPAGLTDPTSLNLGKTENLTDTA